MEIFAKLEKRIPSSALVLLVMKTKGISNIRVKKCYDDNDDNRDDLLSIEERGKKRIMFL